jgi:hypothetical protein
MDFHDAVTLTKSVDLLGLIEPVTRLRKVSAREYAGPCPKCGGKDRFRVNLDAGWFCRMCQGENKWHDAIDFRQWLYGERITQAIETLLGGRKVDKGVIERVVLERSEHEKARQDEEAQRLQDARAKLQSSRVWEKYHDDDRGRELWRDRGIPDNWQDYFMLGYAPAREWACGDTRFTSDSLTIPYFQYVEPLKYTCISLKHRLLCTDAPGGKYRPEFSGLGNQLFTPMHEEPILPTVLIVEGEIKAMVVQVALFSLDPVPNMTVIGVAGKSIKGELLDELTSAERVYILLDPDASKQAADLRATLGASKCKIIGLPGKVDDLITGGIIDGIDLYSLLGVI